MMTDSKSRLARLTAILTQLQSKRIVTAKEIAKKHNVSIRTIYRDIRTLEESGIPIITEEGKGYKLMGGYNVPPMSFTESEANALITAEHLVLQNKDASLVKEFLEATAKIRAVLKHSERDKADLLKQKIIFRQTQEKTSNYLSALQTALTNSQLIKIVYTDERNNSTKRIIEPFVFYYDVQNWLLFAFCRLRKDFRAFRLDRIKNLVTLDQKYQPQKITFQEFIEKQYSTPDI